jgi:hypothetical protein
MEVNLVNIKSFCEVCQETLTCDDQDSLEVVGGTLAKDNLDGLGRLH